MKTNRIISTLLMSICTIGAFAQEKNIELPKAGDIALGIDVVPMMEYVGNMFATGEGRVNTLSSFGGEETLQNELSINNPNVSIMGKYMLTDKLGIKLNVGVLSRHSFEKQYQRDDLALFENPYSEEKIVDSYKSNKTGASFTLAGEYRIGDGRVQGYAGLGLIYGFEKTEFEVSYGNAVTAMNQQPTRTSAGTPLAVPYWTKTYVTSRYHDGATRYLGFDVMLGVEYFLASKISIGGEVSFYGLSKIEKACYQNQEGYNYLNSRVENRTELVSPGGHSFTLATDNLGAKLFMMFYF